MAATEFKTAMMPIRRPAYQVRLAWLSEPGKNDEAVAIVDKLLADPQLHPAIKQVAQSIKASAGRSKYRFMRAELALSSEDRLHVLDPGIAAPRADPQLAGQRIPRRLRSPLAITNSSSSWGIRSWASCRGSPGAANPEHREGELSRRRRTW